MQPAVIADFPKQRAGGRIEDVFHFQDFHTLRIADKATIFPVKGIAEVRLPFRLTPHSCSLGADDHLGWKRLIQFDSDVESDLSYSLSAGGITEKSVCHLISAG